MSDEQKSDRDESIVAKLSLSDRRRRSTSAAGDAIGEKVP
jgi:hypothetical protein